MQIDKPFLSPDFKQRAKRQRQLFIVLMLSVVLLALWNEGLVLADIPKPDPPPGTTGDNVWEVLIGWAKLAFEAILLLIAAGAFLVAAYAATVGLYRLFTDRDGWATLFGVFIAAIVVTFFVGQMAFEGSELLKQLTLT